MCLSHWNLIANHERFHLDKLIKEALVFHITCRVLIDREGTFIREWIVLQPSKRSTAIQEEPIASGKIKFIKDQFHSGLLWAFTSNYGYFLVSA